MKKAISSLLVAIALYGPACVPAAKAQGVFNMGGLTVTLGMDAVTQSEEERAQGARGGASSTGKVRPRPVPKGSTRFRLSKAARKRNVASWVAQYRAVDPKGGAEVQRVYAQSDPIAMITPALARYGLHTDDVADAMAIYLVTAWYGVRGSTVDAPRASVRGVREQMRRSFLSLPKLASTSNSTKQQLADYLLLQMLLHDAATTKAKGNQAQMARNKSAIRQNALSIFGLDMAKLKLTANGLRA